MILFKYPWHVFSCWTAAHRAQSASAFPLNSLLLPSSSQNSHHTPDPVLPARAPCCKGNEGSVLLNIVKQWEPLDGMCRLWAGAEGSNWLSSTTFLHLILPCIRQYLPWEKQLQRAGLALLSNIPWLWYLCCFLVPMLKLQEFTLRKAGKQMLISYCNSSTAVICQHLHWTEALFAKVWLWQGC